MEPAMKDGALSWVVSTDRARAWVTVTGAQVAPVEFVVGDAVIRPYSLAPWQPGTVPDVPPLLDALRGDFLCLPFGAQSDGPQHGQTASAPWTLADATSDSMTLTLDATDIGASVTKTVSLRDGETNLYQEFTVSGLDGDFPFGTHPILDFSREPIGRVRISTSPLRWASTNAGRFSDPAAGETQILAENAIFDALSAVPLADGGALDLSHYPTPPGHEDLVMLVNDPLAGQIGWSAASCTGYVWFALKDVAALPSTLLWISNGGRTQPPWSSAHTARMGVEDVCSYFADGVDASRAQPLREHGIPTVRHFEPGMPVTFRTLHGVVATPPGFGRVTDIVTTVAGEVTIRDEAGTTVSAPVDWGYVVMLQRDEATAGHPEPTLDDA